MRQKLATYSFSILLLDQVIKLFITSAFKTNFYKEVTSFFNITYIQNHGAAWGILNGNRIFLIITGIITLWILYYFFIKGKLNNNETISLSFLIGGITGNLIDRIFRGYVVDYLQFNIFGYDFPVFNLADMCIVIGTFLLIITMFGSELNDNSRKKS